MFANIYLEMESMIIKEIDSKFVEIGLEKGWYSLHGISIDLIDKEVELQGYDKMKGEEFILFYDYETKKGRLHYMNGTIEPFTIE